MELNITAICAQYTPVFLSHNRGTWSAGGARNGAANRWGVGLADQGGHVIDARNRIDRIADVAIKDGKIARVADDLPAAQAKRVVNAQGLYVTPGIIDIHAHVYAGTGLRAYTGDLSVYPDGFTYRSGVTTVVDAGSAGVEKFRGFPPARD